ncbi:MAG: amidohydrolase family protein [DPANN group archaeon]|nr:amidohydrolase family protein [DPANN group archaeon]
MVALNRTDAHIHLLDRRIMGMNPNYSLELYRDYFKSQNLTTAFVVYNNEECLEKIKQFCKSTKIYGFYWISDPDNYVIPERADAIKFETYIDGFDLLDINPILKADKRNLPVYAHCGELRPDYSDPQKVEILAKEHPKRTFMLGHSGAYGPPIEDIYLSNLGIPQLVSDAIEVAKINPNVYLESSILNYKPKLDLIVNNLDGIMDKLLLGTDFPLTVGSLIGNVPASDYVKLLKPTIMSQEKLILDAGVSLDIISKLYRNADKIFN